MAEKKKVDVFRALTRMTFAETDESFQKFLNEYFVPVLPAVCSTDKTERENAVEIVKFVSQRIRSNQALTIPLQPLVELAMTADESLSHIIVLFLDTAFVRCQDDDLRVSLATDLLDGLSKRPAIIIDVALQMLLECVDTLCKISVTPMASEQRKKTEKLVRFLQSAPDAQIVLQFISDMLLFDATKDVGFLTPGISISAMNRLLYAKRNGASSPTVKPRNALSKLHSKKASFMTLVSHLHQAGFLTDMQVFPLLLIGATCTNPDVVRDAGTELKTCAIAETSINVEDEALVQKLYSMLMGTNRPDVDPDEKRLPCAPALAMKIFSYLSHSVRAANTNPQCLVAISMALVGSNTNPKLRIAGLHFAQWTLNHATESVLHAISAMIFKVLNVTVAKINMLEDYDSTIAKTIVLSSLSQLARREPMLFRTSCTSLSMCFDMLSKAQGTDKGPILECLRALAFSLNCSNLDSSILSELESLLSRGVHSSNLDLQLAAVMAANRAFGFSSCFARFIDLLAGNSSRLDIKEEAEHGLEPYTSDNFDFIPISGSKEDQKTVQQKCEFPSFSSMVHFITVRKKEFFSTNSASMKLMIKFLRDLLFKPSSSCTPAEALKAVDPETINHFFNLVLSVLESNPGDDVLFFGALALHELAWCFPKIIASSTTAIGQVSFVNYLLGALQSGSFDSRELFAHILALIADDAIIDRLLTIINEDSRSTRIVGPSIALSLAIINGSVEEKRKLKAFDLIQSLTSPDHQEEVLVYACKCVSIIAQSRVCFPVTIYEKLLDLLKQKQRTVIESTVLALGSLFIGEENRRTLLASDKLDTILNGLFSLSESKNEEVLFSVGTALCYIAMGRDAKNAPRDPLTPKMFQSAATAQSPEPSFNDEPLRTVMKRINALLPQSQLKRSAACTWLVDLVTNCGSHPLLQSNFENIQEVFLSLLGDNNDVIQDIASRGLVMMFENGSPEVRKKLVSALTATLLPSSDAKATTKVYSADDIVLPPSGLSSSSSSGNSLSTYKDLCAMANEMGKPELVYSFMSVAGNQTLWQTRRGAAETTSILISHAKKELEPLLPSLFPVIYRQSFDSNPKVAQAMSKLLVTLCDNNVRKTLETTFEPTMKELIRGLQAVQWRVREASANAVAGIASGSFASELIIPHVQELLRHSFRVADDVKETTRNAGLKALVVLGKLVVRLCDPTQTDEKLCHDSLAEVLPLLSQNGLESPVEEVKRFAALTLREVCHAASKALVPFVPNLLETLLQALSSLEPLFLSYFAQKAGDDEAQLLDEIRGTVSKKSPVSGAIEYCLQQVTKDNIADVCSVLISLATHAIGLPSRVGVAQAVTAICQQSRLSVADGNSGSDFAVLLSPHSKALANAFMKTLHDESASVRKAYSSAIGQLANVTCDKTLLSDVVHNLSEAYFTSIESNQRRESCALVCKEIVRSVNPERLTPCLNDIVVLIFVGKHDSVKEISSVFDGCYAELSVGGVGAFVTDIAKVVCEKMLQDKSFVVRQQAARTTCTLCRSIGERLPQDIASQLIAAFRSAVSGRIWDGKGVLFEAFAAVYKFGAVSYENEADSKELVQLFITEAAKPNVTHRPVVLAALVTLLEAVPPSFNVISDTRLLDMLGKAVTAQNKCAKAIADAQTAEAKAQQQKEISAVAQRSQATAEAVLKCLLHGLRASSVTGPASADFIKYTDAVCQSMICSPASQQLHGFKLLERLLELRKTEASVPETSPSDSIWNCLTTCLQSRFELVRSAALQYVSHVLHSNVPMQLLVKPHAPAELQAIIKDSFQKTESFALSDTVKDVLSALESLM